MRKQARANGKVVPALSQLYDLLDKLDGMKCPACERPMNWWLTEGSSTVITLQHDRDGTIRLICKGCNSRHHLHPGDSYYQMPRGHKRCPTCETVKPLSEFYFIKTRGQPSSRCRSCEKAAVMACQKARKLR
jgi:hypothetical protein